MKYIIGNWKANKNSADVIHWSDVFLKEYTPREGITFIACPPFPFLGYLQQALKNVTNVFVGAQTLASIEEGSYTGETTAKTLQGIVSFAIIGHSERRKHFHESDEDLAKKVFLAKKYNIEPIYCIRDEKDPIPEGVKFVAYEPVAAIGTGQNEPPEQVVQMKKKMSLPADCVFIYGGSVNEKNSASYLATGEIDGFLIGKASLDASQFLSVAKTG